MEARLPFTVRPPIDRIVSSVSVDLLDYNPEPRIGIADSYLDSFLERFPCPSSSQSLGHPLRLREMALGSTVGSTHTCKTPPATDLFHHKNVCSLDPNFSRPELAASSLQTLRVPQLGR